MNRQGERRAAYKLMERIYIQINRANIFALSHSFIGEMRITASLKGFYRVFVRMH
jgi:hypothetical protein